MEERNENYLKISRNLRFENSSVVPAQASAAAVIADPFLEQNSISQGPNFTDPWTNPKNGSDPTTANKPGLGNVSYKTTSSFDPRRDSRGVESNSGGDGRTGDGGFGDSSSPIRDGFHGARAGRQQQTAAGNLATVGQRIDSGSSDGMPGGQALGRVGMGHEGKAVQGHGSGLRDAELLVWMGDFNYR